MKRLHCLLFAATFFLTTAAPFALAAPDHKSAGPHGGQIRETPSFELELVVKDKQLMVYVTDHKDRKLDVTGATGTATVFTGKGKETIKLVAAGGNALSGDGAGFALAADMKVIVSVTMSGKTEQTRFAPMEKDKAGDHSGHKH